MHLFYWDFLEDLMVLKQRIDAGKVIVGETDTVIGLFALCSKESFQMLNTIKGRSNRPYIFLVSDVEKAKKIAHLADHAIISIIGSVVWPGPVTLVVRASQSYLYAAAPDGTIAIRVPGDEIIRSFLINFDALFSTSANKHKEPVPLSINAINPELLSHVDSMVVFKEERGIKKPSTIITIEGNTILLLRGILDISIITMLEQRGFTITAVTQAG